MRQGDKSMDERAYAKPHNPEFEKRVVHNRNYLKVRPLIVLHLNILLFGLLLVFKLYDILDIL